MNDVGTSYLLWVIWFFGAAGLHRLYNKKFFTGILWLCTWGLFGVGQIVDVLLIPNMVDEHNAKVRARLGYTPTGMPLSGSTVEVVVRQAPPVESVAQPVNAKSTKDELMVKLLKAAQARGGKLSVTQAVIDTECGFAEVEATLQDMLKTGYVAVGNDPHTGIVIYDFVEL